MDGFDDLLGPSRHILEENPFEDPFAKRSNSPDPWAAPYVHQDSYHQTDTYSHDPVPTTPSTQTNENEPTFSHTEPERTTVDPLDFATLSAEKPIHDGEQLSETRSPGFRESIAPVFSETATIKPTEAEEMPPVLKEEVTYQPAITRAETSSLKSPAISSPPGQLSPSEESTPQTDWGAALVVSPLERSPATVPLESAFPRLSLGGESAGWQGQDVKGSWVNEGTTADRQPSEEDSDDDKPIGQTLRAAPQYQDPNKVTTSQPPLLRNNSGLQPVFIITVDDPQKVGDPIRAFTMYTVHTRTTSPLFNKSAFSVLRRYSDFLWLYETLSMNNPGVVVPPVPEKNTFGRFDDQFVRQRRFALEKCIQKIANHPLLGKDPDLKLFLESDTFALDIKHRKAEIAHERGGIMASIGQSIAGPRFYETDEWFDRQKVYLDSLESQLRGLVRAIDAVAKQRAELAAIAGEFAQAVGDLSASDIGKQLSHSMAGLADVERTAQDLQSTQSEQDITTFMGTVDEYARLVNSVRMAFNSRIRTYHAWKYADGDLLRIKQTHEKNRAQGRIPPERLGYSLSQIAEAEKRAAEAKLEFEQVSKLVKSEVARFEQERIADFKDSLHAFLEGMIARQKQLIAAWEDYQQLLLKKVSGGGAQAGVHEALIAA